MQASVEGKGDGFETEVESAVLEDVFLPAFKTGYGGGHLFDQADAVGDPFHFFLIDHVIVDDVALNICFAYKPAFLEGAV